MILSSDISRGCEVRQHAVDVDAMQSILQRVVGHAWVVVPCDRKSLRDYQA